MLGRIDSPAEFANLVITERNGRLIRLGEVADVKDATEEPRTLARLKPRERSLLWLAYAQGLSHEEIAGTLGLSASSIKALLFRARKKFAGLLQERGK